MKKLPFLILLCLPMYSFSQTKLENSGSEKIEEVKAENICSFVDEEGIPQFPGGLQELLKFLDKNLKYPPKAKENKIEGKVFVEITVDTNGKILNPKIIKSDNPLFNEEAIRLIKSMPKWIPGKRKGVPIKQRLTFPISFRLRD